MSSGKTHDKLGLYCTPIAGWLTYSITRSPELTAAATGAFFAGIWWLSPDLDIKSRPWKRWGPLRWLWIPYQKLGKHRGVSHTPIRGTIGRLIYLGAIAFILALLMGMPVQKMVDVGLYFVQDWPMAIAIFGGLVASTLVHLAADGIL